MSESAGEVGTNDANRRQTHPGSSRALGGRGGNGRGMLENMISNILTVETNDRDRQFTFNDNDINRNNNNNNNDSQDDHSAEQSQASQGMSIGVNTVRADEEAEDNDETASEKQRQREFEKFAALLGAAIGKSIGEVKSEERESDRRDYITPKVEVRGIEDMSDKAILAGLRLVKNQAHAGKYGLAFDSEFMKKHLPESQAKRELLDKNDPDHQLMIKAARMNDHGVNLMVNTFKHPSAVLEMSESMTAEYPAGVAYKMYDAMVKRTIPEEESAPLIINKQIQALALKQNENPQKLEDEIHQIRELAKLAGVTVSDEALTTRLETICSTSKDYKEVIDKAKTKMKDEQSDAVFKMIAQYAADGVVGPMPTIVPAEKLKPDWKAIINGMKTAYKKTNWNNNSGGGGKDSVEEMTLWVQQNFEKRKCHQCGKIGHIKKDCPNKKQDGKNDAKGKTNDDGKEKPKTGPNAPHRIIKGMDCGPPPPDPTMRCNECGQKNHYAT